MRSTLYDKLEFPHIAVQNEYNYSKYQSKFREKLDAAFFR